MKSALILASVALYTNASSHDADTPCDSETAAPAMSVSENGGSYPAPTPTVYMMESTPSEEDIQAAMDAIYDDASPAPTMDEAPWDATIENFDTEAPLDATIEDFDAEAPLDAESTEEPEFEYANEEVKAAAQDCEKELEKLSEQVQAAEAQGIIPPAKEISGEDVAPQTEEEAVQQEIAELEQIREDFEERIQDHPELVEQYKKYQAAVERLVELQTEDEAPVPAATTYGFTPEEMEDEAKAEVQELEEDVADFENDLKNYPGLHEEFEDAKAAMANFENKLQEAKDNGDIPCDQDAEIEAVLTEDMTEEEAQQHLEAYAEETKAQIAQHPEVQAALDDAEQKEQIFQQHMQEAYATPENAYTPEVVPEAEHVRC